MNFSGLQVISPKTNFPRDTHPNPDVRSQPIEQQARVLTNEQIVMKAEQASEQQLKQWVADGMLQKIGKTYKVLVVFSGGCLLANAKPVNPAANMCRRPGQLR